MAETFNISTEAEEEFKALDTDDLSAMAAPIKVEPTDAAAIALAAEDTGPGVASEPPAPVEAAAAEEAADSPEKTEVHAPAGPAAAVLPTSIELREIHASGQQPQTGKALKSRRILKAVCALALVFALAGGVWLYANRSRLRAFYSAQTPGSSASAQPAQAHAHGSAAAPSEGFDPLVLEAALREIDALRHELLAKKDEIVALLQGYQEGIQELEEEAVRLIRRTAVDSLPAAMKKQEIALLLHSIQRRQGYSEGLGKPLSWLDLGSEELLYLKRRAILEHQVKNISEHIDINATMHSIETALQKYRPEVDRLAISSGAVATAPLESVWKRLSEQGRNLSITAEGNRNQEITDEVCSGNLGRLSDLTSLSLKGARCLAESGARELFLTRLTDIPPAAAKRLAEWPGHWLCLNAINRLSPELARHVFAWPGDWISLNGLSELPPESARLLAGWKGRQLELMGLRKPAGVEHLAQWEAAGGRLYVPEDIRREINAIRGLGRSQPGEKKEGSPQRSQF